MCWVLRVGNSVVGLVTVIGVSDSVFRVFSVSVVRVNDCTLG